MNIDDVFHTTKFEKEYKRSIVHWEYVRKHWDEVCNIKELIANDQAEAARGVYAQMPVDLQIGLWRAVTKGGCFTAEERKALKPNESTETRLSTNTE